MPYDLYEAYARDNVNSLTYAGYPTVNNLIFSNFDTFWKNNGKGLAEFTNRNFVSRNTNFDDPAYQNYNAPVSTGEQILTSTIQVATYDVNNVPELVPVQVNVRYPLGAVVDQYTGAVSQLVRLTAYSIFDYETNRFNQGRVFSQNDLVYKDYADILVPRAVGYSAGMLNYFFRGEINLEPSVTDPTRYVVRNKSAEDMYGTFRIFYDDLLDQRKLLVTAETQSAPPGGTTMLMTIDEPADAREPGKYIVVFKGTMGSENGAVVGKIGKPWPLDITPPDNLVYSIIDGSGTQQQFKHIKAKVRNADSSKQIQSGTLQAVARYKRRINYDPYLTNELDATPYKESIFSYSVSAPLTITGLDAFTPVEFTFNFSGDPIPAGIADLSLRIIFRGTMFGGDPAISDNGAVAEGTKDMSEPTHHVFWNLTDMFSLNYHLYEGEAIAENPDLRKFVDEDHDGILNEVEEGEPFIDHRVIHIEVSYGDPAATAGIPMVRVNLPAGRHIRLLHISEPNREIGFWDTWDDGIGDPFTGQNTFFPAFSEDRDGQWILSPMYKFRNVTQHKELGVLWCSPTMVTANGEEFCPYDESEAIPADPIPYQAHILFP